METNYRIAYDKGWRDLKKKVPEEIVSRRSVSYCSSNRQFTMPFFNSEYILDCDNETITRKTDGQIPEIIASIIILNYLSFSDTSPELDQKWVSLKEIPNGGALFYPAFRKNAVEVLIRTFGNQTQELLTCAAALGGQPASLGSASVVFHAFPEIPICAVMWEGDEEVRANATVLYDPSIAYLLHIESLIGLGMYLSAKLKQLASSL
ncbi:DUF3786 domain-containing protein [Sporomusa sp. KB1]|uniref:DUF3786 domain-containing protein n=1 Tax=Sporomusa sp. KB1 TaxID=943346 RepID=UPI00119E1161|nr:DUF3786 domain-containing protein [Sporomusa sp. KB1]TWH49402.1 uncharacterized protein DUF3786 [Sporomusa sp. KB1]